MSNQRVTLAAEAAVGCMVRRILIVYDSIAENGEVALTVGNEEGERSSRKQTKVFCTPQQCKQSRCTSRTFTRGEWAVLTFCRGESHTVLATFDCLTRLTHQPDVVRLI